jgi:hypothetical protein
LGHASNRKEAAAEAMANLSLLVPHISSAASSVPSLPFPSLPFPTPPNKTNAKPEKQKGPTQ